MKRRLLLYLAAGGLAFTAAFFARRSTAAPPSTPVFVIPEAPRAAENAAQFSREWAAALAGPQSVSRTEAMQEALATARGASLADLAERHRDDTDTLALILRRWAEADVRAAAAWTRQAVR